MRPAWASSTALARYRPSPVPLTRFVSSELARGLDAFPIDLQIVGLEKIGQHLKQRLAVHRLLAPARDEIVGVGEEIRPALPVRRQRTQFLDNLEAGNACQFQDVAAVAGFGELRDAADAADPEQLRPCFILAVRNIRLDHPDQPVTIA